MVFTGAGAPEVTGPFDPVGFATGTAKEEALAIASSHGAAAFHMAITKKVAPELDPEVEWVGAAGPGVGSRRKRDVFRLKGAEQPEDTKKVEKGAKKLSKGSVSCFFERREFGWKALYHPLHGQPDYKDSIFTMEVPFVHNSLRLYTDHRVVGNIVLPGASHISLMCTGAVIMAQAADARVAGKKEDEAGVLKEVLFERPYFVSATPGNVDMGMPTAVPAGTITCYCSAGTAKRDFVPSKMK